MNKTLMAGLGVLVIIVVLGGGYLLLNKSNSANQTVNTTNVNTNSSQTEMNMTSNQSATQSSNQTAVATNSVTIENFAFSPATVTVKVGDKVTWTNKDGVAHSATADDNSWDTGLLAQGGSKSITFSKAGTYTYHCSVHPNMHGTVVVK